MSIVIALKAWVLYESCRSIAMYFIRQEIARIAGTASTCRKCRWRLFCTRTALLLRSHFTASNARRGIIFILAGLAFGNADQLWMVLQTLLKERIANARRKKETNVPGPGLRHGK